jgi:hypothetical protein
MISEAYNAELIDKVRAQGPAHLPWYSMIFRSSPGHPKEPLRGYVIFATA